MAPPKSCYNSRKGARVGGIEMTAPAPTESLADERGVDLTEVGIAGFRRTFELVRPDVEMLQNWLRSTYSALTSPNPDMA